MSHLNLDIEQKRDETNQKSESGNLMEKIQRPKSPTPDRCLPSETENGESRTEPTDEPLFPMNLRAADSSPLPDSPNSLQIDESADNSMDTKAATTKESKETEAIESKINPDPSTSNSEVVSSSATSANPPKPETSMEDDAYADVANHPLLGQRPSSEVLQLLNEQTAAERRAREVREEHEKRQQQSMVQILFNQPGINQLVTAEQLATLPPQLLNELHTKLTQNPSTAASDSKVAINALASLAGNTPTVLSSQPQGIIGTNSESRKRREVYRWESNLPIFAMGWSFKRYPDQRLRLACSSIRDSHELLKNTMSIVEFDEENGELCERAQVFIGAPSCELRFVPNADPSQPDLIASATRELRIYSYHPEQREVILEAKMAPNKSYAYAGPLTSVDWNETDQRIIGGSSIDSTCTIWDVEAQESIGVVPPQPYDGEGNRRLKYNVRTQLIAHERPVHDLAFSKLGSGRDYFASCGADGSVRMFDLRNLKHSTILYEHPNKTMLNHVCWNKIDPSQFATVADDSNKLIVCDVRMPCQVLYEYGKHSKPVNSIDWAPHSPTHLCSGSSDNQALIWQLQNGEEPLLAYQSEGEITRIRWSATFNNWIGISFSNFLEILRV
ncbi:WD40 repeat domain containing protein [Aphelenchoides besseyi]|nr:WD40 repeat domain containing protein [Aphelenchoides besseyi]